MEKSADIIYIFGHKNPDTDSICSSIAYANLKKQMGFKEAKAFRLGEINAETEFVLDYFKIKQPKLLKDLKVNLESLDLYKPTIMSKKDPIKKVWDIMKNVPHNRLIPAVDKNGIIEGILSLGDIAKIFMEVTDQNITEKYEILFENLLEILNGEIKFGNYKFRKIEGRIIAGSIVEQEKDLNEKDVIITSKIETAEYFANDGRCGAIIITNDQKVNTLKNAKCAIVPVKYSLFKSISLVIQSVSIQSVMKKGNLTVFNATDKLEDISEIIKTSPHRNYPVVNDKEEFVGILSRRHFIDYPRYKVILVDHNERSQTIDSIDDSEIIEIIDHHRVADIQTESPLYIRSEPVGCTSTIIYKIYKESDEKIPQKIAGIMLSAILSDTLVFNSPTCTESDKIAAFELAKIAKVDVAKYAKEMFLKSTDMSHYSDEKIIKTDCKTFVFGKTKALISQVNTVDCNKVMKREENLMKEMSRLCEMEKANFMILMITDIVLGGSIIIVAGKSLEIVKSAFEIPHGDNYVFLEKVVSRKKQIVPKINSMIKSM